MKDLQKIAQAYIAAEDKRIQAANHGTIDEYKAAYAEMEQVWDAGIAEGYGSDVLFAAIVEEGKR